MGEWLEIGPSGSRAYLAVPQRGAGAGVLVLHAWWGLTPVFTDICDRLAAEGFVALAPDIYGNGATTDSIDEAEKLVGQHDSAPEIAKAILQSGVETLRGLPPVAGDRIGVIGFSMGGYWALHLSQANSPEVAAVVSVYGTGDADFTKASASYLGHFGENDDFEPLDGVRALESSIRDAGRDVTFHIYPGARHWFVEPNRPEVYDPEAAAMVWEHTLEFLKSRLN
jgi:carboxymethylenebutenolidase